jgi:hypothetical protein
MLSHERRACLTPSECTGAVYQDEVVVVLTLLLLPYDPARPAQLDRVYDRGCVVQATDCHVFVYACSLRTERNGVNAALLPRLLLRLLRLLPCSTLDLTRLSRYARIARRPYHVYASIQT